MARVTTRPAETRDAETIHQLIVSFVPEFTVDPDPASYADYLELVSVSALEGYIANKETCYRVAMLDDRLVGAAAMRHDAHLFHFFVAGDCHGQGIGRKMLDELCSIVGGDRFTVNATPNARAVYRHLGFVETDEQQSSHGIYYTPMELRIDRRSAS